MKDYVYRSGPGKRGQFVWIATPTTETVVLQHAFSLAATVETLTRGGYQFAIHYLQGNCHVDDARNHMIAQFLNSAATDLVWIDSDQSWRAEDLCRLLSHDVDIVAGIPCHKGNDDSYPYDPPKGAVVDGNGLIAMDRVGTGFTRMRKRVLKDLADIEREKGRVFYDGETGLPIARIVERGFPGELDLPGTKYMSGDHVLSAKAKQAGYSIAVDPECKLGHIGTQQWDGHLGGWLRNRHGIDEPSFVEQIKQFKRKGTCDYNTLSRASGNPLYVLKGEELERIVAMAHDTSGPILELGTGASTLLMALAAPDRVVTALEHDVVWFDHMAARLQRYGVTNVKLIYAPIRPYQNGMRWYETGREVIDNYGLVVCDGPPKRYGRAPLFTIMGDCIRGAAVFVDDIERDPEMLAAFEAWASKPVIKDGRERLHAYCEKAAA